MTGDNQHIIQKVLAELVISHEREYHEKSEQLKDAIQQSIERVSDLFDRVPADSLFEIDSLAVEININEEEFSQIGKKLDRIFSKKFQEILQAGFLKENKKNITSETGVIPPENRRQNLVIYFLQTGLIPWWAAPSDFQDSVEWMKSRSAKQIQEIIKPLMKDNPMILRRLAIQYSPEFIERIIKKLAAENFGSDEISAFLRVCIQFSKVEAASENLYKQVRNEIYWRILHDLFVKSGLKSLLTGMIIFTVQALKTYDENSERSFQKLIRRLQKQKKSKNTWEKHFENLTWKEVSAKKIPGIDLVNSANTSDRNIIDLKESITLFNAGVILLHSFIPALFKNLGYIEGGEFVNKSVKERAVCTVHYLATGNDEFPEHELLISKFLCGWPLEEPINRFLPLSDYEKNECNSLLANVIQHWEALKNTTPSGLQKNFLQREGILKKEGFGWTLYIESKTHDILLDKLPWGFSIIKLKWMDEMLTVNWN